MARKAHAGRYAQAIFEIAQEKKELDRWQSDLEKIVGVVGDAELMTVLESPKLRFDDKSRLLSESLKGIGPLALNLVHLLVTKGRLDIIADIADEYQRLLDSYHGIERAEVSTAIPLDDEDKLKLTEYLSAVVDKGVSLRAETNPGIIGGITVRVGGKLLDGSTRSMLAALKRELIGVERKR